MKKREKVLLCYNLGMNKITLSIVSFIIFSIVFDIILFLIDKNMLTDLLSKPLNSGVIILFLPALVATISLQKNLRQSIITSILIIVVYTALFLGLFANWNSEYAGMNLITVPIFIFAFALGGALIGSFCKHIRNKFYKNTVSN